MIVIAPEVMERDTTEQHFLIVLALFGYHGHDTHKKLKNYLRLELFTLKRKLSIEQVVCE